MEKNLGVPVDAFVEFVVRARGLVKRELMRHDERRFRASGDDQVAEIPVIFLYHPSALRNIWVELREHTLTLH